MEIAIYTALIISIISIVLSLYLCFSIIKANKLIKSLTGLSSSELSDKMNKSNNDLQSIVQRTDELGLIMEEIAKNQKMVINKIALHRYNPYSDTGGNLSFILIILDGNKSGIVINSLHTREMTRIYSKPINNGVIDGQVSEDEKMALQKALL